MSDAVPIRAVSEPCLLGESPMWHPEEGLLYWCDIDAHALYRLDPLSGASRRWDLPCEVSACAPLLGGGLLLAMRDGLWRFDVHSARRFRIAPAPYDSSRQRFNDGKCDPQGRFWIGSIDEPRRPEAALYRWDGRELTRQAGGITTSNGLAWSPDGRTLYWSDTRAHTIYAFDFDPAAGSLSSQRVFCRFEPRQAMQPLSAYGGRRGHGQRGLLLGGHVRRPAAPAALPDRAGAGRHQVAGALPDDALLWRQRPAQHLPDLGAARTSG